MYIDENELIDVIYENSELLNWQKELFIKCLRCCVIYDRKQQYWIPCSQLLPSTTNSYLVTKHISETEDRVEQYETCTEIFWTRDGKWDCERDEYCEWKVIAWRPRPQPYKEETKC